MPSLRHPMVTAAAIGTLAAQAPGRVSVAIGSGFTGRVVLGQKPMRWADVAQYVQVLRTLLAGEDALWEGHRIRMLQPPSCGAGRPIEIPILIGADVRKVSRSRRTSVTACSLPTSRCWPRRPTAGGHC